MILTDSDSYSNSSTIRNIAVAIPISVANKFDKPNSSPDTCIDETYLS
jgi:hypothetical protein